jgi:hypothetical protein
VSPLVTLVTPPGSCAAATVMCTHTPKSRQCLLPSRAFCWMLVLVLLRLPWWCGLWRACAHHSSCRTRAGSGSQVSAPPTRVTLPGSCAAATKVGSYAPQSRQCLLPSRAFCWWCWCCCVFNGGVDCGAHVATTGPAGQEPGGLAMRHPCNTRHPTWLLSCSNCGWHICATIQAVPAV